MGPPSSRSQPDSRRQPLGDASLRANINTSPSRSVKAHSVATTPSNRPLLHHESLFQNPPLNVRDATSSPENKRLSAVTNEDQIDSKRSSQISTTSTNASAKGRRKTHIGPWQLGSDVGQGGVGRVRKVRHALTGQQAAVKIIPKKAAEFSRAESLANLVKTSKTADAGVMAPRGHVMPFGIEREVVIMKLLEHPNVIKLYDIWENRNELYLIMEYVDGGELFDYITEYRYLGEDETVWLFRQILAALLHCSRLGIHHRDLKPENILLERESLTIKLGDFGMAALQPKGKKLTTPCGSFHYAAPEVFEKIYDGSKIDVWSLGVILYIMLTGTTPFHYDPDTMAHNNQLWYDTLKAGKFEMPEDFSPEAKDLVRRMLVPDPEHRISLGEIWKHPFIHKFGKEWGESPADCKLDRWVGRPLTIDKWVIKKVEDIDREILRNLRTLWHSEKEEVLIKRLLSEEPNQEKYFYSALRRHQEEQLENYDLGLGIDYSTSDYHYIKSSPAAADVPPLPSHPYTRTKSTFSILNDEHLHSKASFFEPPPSVSSYDPFRASRDPIIHSNGNYTNVVVHRNGSHSRQQSNTQSLRHGNSLRVEAIKNEHRRISACSNHSSIHLSPSSRHKRSAYARSVSRTSVASSTHLSSPSAVRTFKPTMKHKRGVDFSQIRKGSAASLFSTRNATRGSAPTPRKARETARADADVEPSSPVASRDNDIRSRKEGATRRSGSRPKDSNSQVIDGDARKYSCELEKLCEDSFFREESQLRSSVGSSHRTSALATSNGTCETPPSSVSNHASGFSNQATQRRLPDIVVETPTTFMTRELEETRKRLAARYATDENAQNATYHEVLAHLDALLKPNTGDASTTGGKRTSSAPEPRTPEHSSQLPVIREEGRLYGAKQSNPELSNAARDEKQRPYFDAQIPQKTIRIIDQLSPPRVAPLNIRKVSGASAESRSTGSSENANTRYYSNVNTGTVSGRAIRRPTPTSPRSLDSISEETEYNAPAGQSTLPIPHQKRTGWFRRRNTSDENLAPSRGDHRNNGDSNPPFTQAQRISEQGNHTRLTDASHGRVNELDVEEEKTTPVEKKSGFLRFLGKRRATKATPNITIALDDDDATSQRSLTEISTHSSAERRKLQKRRAPQSDHSDRDLGVQRHWLARFLNIKPATKIMCFNAVRGRARAELVRLLRSWRIYGIRDIVLDRERNLIFGRLDSLNHLGIKEVSFVIELFVVLEKGRRCGMSIARFTQRKGAASSFKRVIDTAEAMLKGRGLLVADKRKVREMEEILTGA